MNVAILTPAYGRDYKSKGQVRTSLEGREDFILHNITDKFCGKPAHIGDLITAGYTHAEIHYCKRMKVAMFPLTRFHKE